MNEDKVIPSDFLSREMIKSLSSLSQNIMEVVKYLRIVGCPTILQYILQIFENHFGYSVICKLSPIFLHNFHSSWKLSASYDILLNILTKSCA